MMFTVPIQSNNVKAAVMNMVFLFVIVHSLVASLKWLRATGGMACQQRPTCNHPHICVLQRQGKCLSDLKEVKEFGFIVC